MALEISGKIILIMPKTSGTSKAGKDWTKQEFVIETQEQYPRKVMMSVMGDKVTVLANYSVGSDIKASLNISSREYNGKWYTEVNAWKLEGHNHGNTADPFAQENEPSFTADSNTDDLPF